MAGDGDGMEAEPPVPGTDILEEDLYGDLFLEGDTVGQVAPAILIGELKEKIEMLKKEKKEALQQVQELKEKNASLEEERAVLIKNLSSIFKTAQLEIKRKDMFISELREENEKLRRRR